MNRILLAGLPAVLFLMAAAAGATSQGPYPETQDALDAEYAKLTWIEEPGSYKLEASNSAVTLGPGRSLLAGADAERLLFLMNAVQFPNTEAVLYDDESGVMVTFEFFEEGFVKDGDWTDVEASQLLEDIRAGTEEANREREKYGISTMTVSGWAEEPNYDPETNTVRWAIEFAEGDGSTINATALSLSRYGYEQLTWVGTREQYAQLSGLLTTALDSHVFDDGHRYADFQDGDKVAAYGVAALVAAATGAKLGKGVIAVIIAVAVAFLKKGWIVVLLLLGGIGAWVRKLLLSRKEQAPAGGE